MLDSQLNHIAFLDNPILPPKQALSEIKEFHSPLKIAQRVKTIKTIIFSLKKGKYYHI